MLIPLVPGFVIWRLTRKSPSESNKFQPKDAYLSVAFSWIIISFYSALPYFFHSDTSLSFIDALFESVSGLTTTGSTIIDSLESIPSSLLFWRAFTQWLGGMGIIVLTLAILPLIGVGGLQIYFAESPGPLQEKISPRLSQTAKTLWSMYIIFTILIFILLYASGMTVFEAVVHSFTSISSAGFSTEDESLRAFKDISLVYYVMIFSMLIAGTSFHLHYHALTGKISSYFKNSEFLLFISLIIICSILIFINVPGEFWVIKAENNQLKIDYLAKMRDIVFQVVSIITSTGYVSSDYDQWPDFSRLVFILLMFCGGCGNSTAGGIKIIRTMVLFKYLFHQIRKIIHPNQIFVMKIGKRVIDKAVVDSILGFLSILLAMLFLSTLLLTFLGHELLTSFTASLSTLNNIGPALMHAGPTETFSFFCPFSKGILIFNMLAGRLELLAIIILFYPGTWRRL